MLSVPARYIRTPLALLAATTVALLIIFMALNQSAEADGNAVNVAAGSAHTCAVTDSGGVQCWGGNDSGQLGNGTTDSTTIPIDVCADAACEGPLQDIVAVTADNDHTCALNESGGVLCWGWNEFGQLGDGSNTDRTTPVGVVGLDSGAEAITAGFGHSCALLAGGGVECWGLNTSGQLGDGTSDSSAIPVSVCEPVFPLLGEPSGILEFPCEPISYAASVSAGASHTCVVTDEGGVNCWGANGSGQLGNGTTSDRNTPDEACTLNFILLGEPAPSGEVFLPCAPISGAVSVSAGGSHTCALSSDTGILCWGSNALGQLGDNTTNDSLYPVDVCQPLLIILGEGLDEGDPSGVAPNPCPPIGNMASISAGGGYTCSLTATGGGKCWGWNPAGKLGDGSILDSDSPVNVDGLGNGEQIVAAFGHSCAVRTGGSILCWGNNSSGQLGDGTNADRLSPVEVFGLGGKATATPSPAPSTTTPTPSATAEPGTPEATASPSPTATPAVVGLTGDVDCNGSINAIDAAFLLQLVAGLIEELPCKVNADVNEDGTINTIDTALILQFTAGLLGSLPP